MQNSEIHTEVCDRIPMPIATSYVPGERVEFKYFQCQLKGDIEETCSIDGRPCIPYKLTNAHALSQAKCTTN